MVKKQEFKSIKQKENENEWYKPPSFGKGTRQFIVKMIGSD